MSDANAPGVRGTARRDGALWSGLLSQPFGQLFRDEPRSLFIGKGVGKEILQPAQVAPAKCRRQDLNSAEAGKLHHEVGGQAKAVRLEIGPRNRMRALQTKLDGD